MTRHRAARPGRKALAAAAVATVGFAAGLPVGVTVLLSLLGPALLVRVDRAASARRARALAAQLPDALGALAAALRAGRALPQAVADLARSAPPPLGTELALVARETGVGVPLDASLDRLVQAAPGEDVRLAVVALQLGRGLGGDLADLADRVAEAIRERQRLEARLRVLTSQGRAQGLVLVLLPAALALAIRTIDADYLMPLVSAPAGRIALAVTLLLQVVGIVAIRKITAVER